LLSPALVCIQSHRSVHARERRGEEERGERRAEVRGGVVRGWEEREDRCSRGPCPTNHK